MQEKRVSYVASPRAPSYADLAVRAVCSCFFCSADDIGSLREEGLGRHAHLNGQQRPPGGAGHLKAQADAAPVEHRGKD